MPGDPLTRAREPLVAAAKGRDAAIGFEDGAGDPQLAVTARARRPPWELRVKGTPAHSSQVFRPEVGAGAMYEAARILNAFREKLSSEEHLTFNPGVISRRDDGRPSTPRRPRGSAFGKTNVVAEQAR